MTELKLIVKRNIKLFFKDKGSFLPSLITPVILLVLYISFLRNVYMDSFALSLGEAAESVENILSGLVGGQLMSSILAVCCITVPVCSNMICVQDKANGTILDLKMSPVKASALSLGYYLSTLFSSLLICFTGMGVCLVYVFITGWYMTFSDVLFLCLDVFLLVTFGTALSSIIGHFLSSGGQIAAVGTIISSGYGFICGAYMPISQFSPLLKKIISVLPGTFGTSLVRNHSMQGALNELEKAGIPKEAVEEIKNAVDCNLYFLGNKVSVSCMYAVVLFATLVLISLYVAKIGRASCRERV